MHSAYPKHPHQVLNWTRIAAAQKIRSFASEMPINNETERMLSSRQEQLVLCPAVNDQPFGGSM